MVIENGLTTKRRNALTLWCAWSTIYRGINRNLALCHARTYLDGGSGVPGLRYTEELIVILHHAMRELTWIEVLVCVVYDIQRN